MKNFMYFPQEPPPKYRTHQESFPNKATFDSTFFMLTSIIEYFQNTFKYLHV